MTNNEAINYEPINIYMENDGTGKADWRASAKFTRKLFCRPTAQEALDAILDQRSRLAQQEGK